MKVFKSLSQRENFSRDQGDLPPFLRQLFTKTPSEVVQPDTAAEILDIVKLAARNGTPIVPRGAGSTAFGQVLPVKGGIVLDLNFFKAVRRLDRGRQTVTVESGIRWSDLDAYLEARGFGLHSYPSSWYSTVGGWVATGGFGIGSLKGGSLRSQVVELWVCTGEGKELRLKSNDPYFHTFFETEGQMGVVLEVTLRVRPRPKQQRPVLLTFLDSKSAWHGANEALRGGFDIFHAAVYNQGRMHHFDHVLEGKMSRKGGAAPKLGYGESCGALFVLESEPERFIAWAKGKGYAVAPDFKSSFAWSERFYPLKGKPYNALFLGNEVLIANDKAGAYVADLERLGKSEGFDLHVEGEVAGKDESLVLASFHVKSTDPARFAKGMRLVFRMDRAGVNRYGAKLYHIGIYNTPYLARKFSSERLAQLRAAKAKLDPKGVFNPGKFFEMTTTKTEWLPGWAHSLGARLGITAMSFPILGDIMTSAAGGLMKSPPVPGDDFVLRTASECVKCGFCLPVCPAFLATRDERTTARGKLFLFQRYKETGQLSQEDVELLHSCMHCGGCTSVCQSTLDLVPAWDDLENRVAIDHGKPTRAIVDFVKSVEESDDYKRLLRKGTIAEYRPEKRN